MGFLALHEVLYIHDRIITTSGGAHGVRDLGALESAVAQPKAGFGGEELYPTLVDKAAALCFFIVQGHPFVDGNKRAGHAAMEVFLFMNGLALEASVDEQENLMLELASGHVSREELGHWLNNHIRPLEEGPA